MGIEETLEAEAEGFIHDAEAEDVFPRNHENVEKTVVFEDSHDNEQEND